MTPVVYDPGYLTYDFGAAHPFSPKRLVMLLDLLEGFDVTPEAIQPAPATRDEVLVVHDAAFVAGVEAASRGMPPTDGLAFGIGTPDVPVFPGMDLAARRLMGGTLHAARLIADGTASRVLQLGGGFHHAHRAHAAGFCVYNDLAAAIRLLLDAGLRVAYLDVDAHHGDGVQSLFADEPRVLTISLHEDGRFLYPGTGNVQDLGTGAGRGYKLNIPLLPGTTDGAYLDAFERVVPHALAWFAPDVLVVMCGADAHHADPLSHLALTTRGFESLFRRIVETADAHTQGRALVTLGGGYDRDATVRVWALLYHVLQDLPLPDRLPRGWLTHWERQLGRPLTPTLHDPPVPPPSHDPEPNLEATRTVCRQLLEQAVTYWY